MKLALISQIFTEFKGGAERFGTELARYFSKKGINIRVFARYIGPSDLKLYGQELPVPKKPPSLRIFLLALWGLSSARKWKADRIFALMPLPEADFYWLAGGVYRFWLKQEHQTFLKRTFFSLLRPHYFVNKYLQERVVNCQMLRKIITVSYLEKELIQTELEIDPKKIAVIPNGINLSRFNLKCRIFRDETRNRLHINSEDKVIIFVSNNFKRKGLDTVIEALRFLNDPSYKLLVIGKDKKKPFLKKAKTLKVHKQIKFLGYISQIEKIYAAADVFVLPSQYDSFATVVLEAMACGLPVIISKTTGASLAVEHAKEGFILDHWKNSRALATYIKDTFGNLKEMGLMASQKAIMFPQEKCFETYYHTIVNSK